MHHQENIRVSSKICKEQLGSLKRIRSRTIGCWESWAQCSFLGRLALSYHVWVDPKSKELPLAPIHHGHQAELFHLRSHGPAKACLGLASPHHTQAWHLSCISTWHQACSCSRTHKTCPDSSPSTINARRKLRALPIEPKSLAATSSCQDPKA